jgi:CsoR family transcriptional regulator, copper-sensing transcriptional repressor
LDHAHKHHHHTYVHSQDEKQAVINRLSKAIGHIEAIKRMVNKDVDCSQILIQLAAVRAAINNTGNLVLKNHINHCIIQAVNEGDDQTIEDLNNAIDRFIK